MTIDRKTLRHEHTTTIVHTLNVNGAILEQTREAKSRLKYNDEQKPSRATVFDVWLKIDGKTKVHWKETRLDGKTEEVTEEDILSKDDKKIFQEDWADKWNPRIKDDELFSISGPPADEMKHAMTKDNSLPSESGSH